MNREIKFRASNIEKNEWVYNLLDLVAIESCAGEMSKITFDNTYLQFNQFTGLKDKNGVEIYEGDILKVEGCYEEYFTVEYHAPEFCLADSKDGVLCDLTWQEWEEGEVIGNIYDNPELLEKIENE